MEGKACDVTERYVGIYLQTAKNHDKPLRIASITQHHAGASEQLTATVTCPAYCYIIRSLQSK